MVAKAFTIPQFISTFQVGRTVVYEEIASGRLETYKLGRRRYISAHAAEKWQRRLEDETAGRTLDAALANPIIFGGAAR